MKIYHDGQYLDSEKITPMDLQDILKNNPKKFAIIATKFGWTINKKENESINQRNTKTKSGQKGHTKRDIQQRPG